MKTLWLTLCLLSAAAVCRADRDIVYAARYYALPGSHRTSHFHIYRINPDGTGKTQLTFGSNDENYPKWVQDGRHIRFVQYFSVSKPPKISVMNADGSGRHILHTLKDNMEPQSLSVPGYRLENDQTNDGDKPDRHILISLKTSQEQTLPVPTHDDLYDTILPMPGSDLVYAANNHNSSVGTDYLFYRLNPTTGTLHYLTEGQFLAWSPSGSHFCTAPGRDTTPYEKRKVPYTVRAGAAVEERSEDKYRTVWAAPLYVRAAGGGKMRQLTPRLSYVTGADWRKE